MSIYLSEVSPVSLFKLSGFLLLLCLVSCASTDQRSRYETIDEKKQAVEYESGSKHKYRAWRLQGSEGFDAINVLLEEVDMLIENNRYNIAEDKLERVLRIKPDYAPAWSRLSWLALQSSSGSNAAQRSLQMAKRSNSFAYDDTQLQVLNWSFIRSASKELHDEDTYQQSVRNIERLTNE